MVLCEQQGVVLPSRNDTTSGDDADNFFADIVQLLTLIAVVIAVVVATSCMALLISQRVKERNRIEAEEARLLQEMAQVHAAVPPQVLLENVETKQRTDLLHEGPPIETPPYSALPSTGESMFVQPGEDAAKRRFSSGSSSSSGHHLTPDESLEKELQERDSHRKNPRKPPRYQPPATQRTDSPPLMR